ncbi:type IV secretion protein Rhs [Niastella koreensis]|uniref:Rhs element Vgr protein n=2 Tax=Niastella koreensis TaxID=354356 RepID=G8TR24_NIAKG|nr:phage baseplate assembly protein V [Niastella koreensis]AEV98938.1 Rhs element Vgr protein [Niastella koreensis GR20-10]OQP43861.1 type IV secretion protein Rhs [Niastella koreensis]
MAQLISSNITIAGTPIKQITSFQLTQNIFDHHYFRLVCPAESLEGLEGGMLQSSRNLIGGVLQASFSTPATGSGLQFRGIVMQVEADRFSGHTGNIIISGTSPTIVLDNGPHCKSWEKKAIKNIAQDVLKHFPQDLLQPQVSPAYPETLAYTVQYKQTAWQFLNFLCSGYGEWLYYDGNQLQIGAPKASDATALTFGSNISRFSMALQVQPANSQMMAYDYLNHDVYTSTPQSIESKAGLNDLGRHVFQASNTVYATQPKVWNNQFVSNKKQLDDSINIRMAMQSSNTVRFSGSSAHPGVKIGGNISIQGQNLYNMAGESYGEYTVLSISHYFDEQGNYSNDFTAVPSTIKLPPVKAGAMPHSETQSAMVTDNHDPKGLGRVRVKFHWMNGAEKTPWIRVTSPHGGGGKGMFFIPEVGEEVIVGFEGDSPIKPYIIGTVYHGKASNAYSNAANDVKALQTRSGNKVIMNDKDGSVFVEDKDGNSMLIDGAGNITVKSNKTVLIDATNEITLKTKKITMLAEDEIVMQSKVLDAQFTETSTIYGKNENNVLAKTTVTIGSDNKVDIGGLEVSTYGKTKVALDSEGSVEANGKLMTTIVGGQVKLNC